MQLLITHVNINCVKVNNNEIIMRNNVLSLKRLKFKTENAIFHSLSCTDVPMLRFRDVCDISFQLY